MSANEDPVSAALIMDRSGAIGNSQDGEGRRALHVRSFQVGSPIKREWDAFTVNYPNATTEIYHFTNDGTEVATVTIVFTTTDKTDIASGSVVNL